MDTLNSFKNYLLEQRTSPLTVKNYLNDIKLFINWFEEKLKTNFTPAYLNQNLINLYRKEKEKKLSFASLKRHLASLRKFVKFLNGSGLIALKIDILNNPEEKKEEDKYLLKDFKNYLYTNNSSKLTIKNYIADIQNFLKWCNETLIDKNEYREKEKILFGKINSLAISEYKSRLVNVLHLSPRSVNRKLSSIRKYLTFLIEKQAITEKQEYSREKNIAEQDKIPLEKINQSLPAESKKGILNQIIHPVILLQERTAQVIASSLERDKEIRISNIPQEFYAPHEISLKNLSLLKKITHHLKYTRPGWYKKYHAFTGIDQLHRAILIIYCIIIGTYIYNNLFQKPESKEVLGARFINPKLLSFRGRLLDASGAPVVKPSNIRFSIYNDPAASGSALLWQDVVYNLKPQANGEFEATLGQSNPIFQNFSLDNPELYLGITINNGEEMSPRERIPVPAFVANSEKLQDMLPITRTAEPKNSILALDSSGNLVIGGKANPAFMVPDGQFSLSGNELLLTSNLSSNGNIRLAPDGAGLISLEKPLANLNGSSSGFFGGGIEIADRLGINASESARAAFIVNNNFAGDVFTASSAGFTRFLVQSNGNVGIGTAIPSQKLEVAGSAVITGDIILAGAARSIYSQNQNPLTIGGTTTGNITLQTAPEATITLASPAVLNSTLLTSGNASFSAGVSILGNTNLVNLLASGNIGIGSANPAAKLDVQGNALFNGNLDFQGTRTIAATALNSLTLGDSNTGNLLLNPSGQVGIGTGAPAFKLDVQDNQAATAAAQIFNTSTSTAAAGLVIKLGNLSSSTASAGNHFISFETSGIGVVGSIQGNSSSGIQLKTAGIADFAEYLPKNPNTPIDYGSLLCLDINGLTYACNGQNDKIVGIASPHPTVIGGQDLGNASIATALTGQVETKVSSLNGIINPGDYITSSNMAGVGVKTITASRIVGRALESYNGNGTGIIKVLVSPAWYSPFLALQDDGSIQILKSTGDPLIIQNSEFTIQNYLGKTINNFLVASKAIIANLEAGRIKAQETVTDSLNVTTDNIIISGKSLSGYLSYLIQNSQRLISPLAQVNEIQTNLISPLSQNAAVAVRLDNDKFSVTNDRYATSSAVATIDNQGNASFSGIITGRELNAKEANLAMATVSGTLTADTIIANNIQGLDQKIASSTSELITNNILNSKNLAFNTAPIDISSLSANLITFKEGLIALEPSTFSDINAVSSIAVGNSLKISDTSINVIGDDLAFQPLRQGGVSFLDGLVLIDTQGNLIAQNIETKGDLKVNGTLSANLISPLPSQDLVIKLSGAPSATSSSILNFTSPPNAPGGSKFSILNSTGAAVLSVNQTGDMAAAGSGTFNKLNLFATQAYAVSETQSLASAAAGLATIFAYQKEITITDPLVNPNSLIYLTPIGNAPVYLLRQAQSSFTVGVSTPVGTDAQFNFLIIN